jgi:hypothetical protein
MGEELEFINTPRENSANFHLMTAQKWRRYGEPKKLHHPLVYAALEYRLAIERIVFELYALLKRLRKVTIEEEKRLENLSSIITQIMDITENSKYLQRMLEFHSILFSDETHFKGELAVPKIRLLKNHWHALSEFCHKRINPHSSWESKEYVEKGYKILNEVENYLWEIKVEKHFGLYRMDTWQPEVIKLAEDYINSKIDKQAVKTRLNLMRPVILARFRKRI